IHRLRHAAPNNAPDQTARFPSLSSPARTTHFPLHDPPRLIRHKAASGSGSVRSPTHVSKNVTANETPATVLSPTKHQSQLNIDFCSRGPCAQGHPDFGCTPRPET